MIKDLNSTEIDYSLKRIQSIGKAGLTGVHIINAYQIKNYLIDDLKKE